MLRCQHQRLIPQRRLITDRIGSTALARAHGQGHPVSAGWLAPVLHVLPLVWRLIRSKPLHGVMDHLSGSSGHHLVWCRCCAGSGC